MAQQAESTFLSRVRDVGVSSTGATPATGDAKASIATTLTALHQSSPHSSAVIYWMSREIRTRDNWALIYARRQAEKLRVPVYCVYNLDVGFLGGGLRQHIFKINGLKVVAENFAKLNIPFSVDTSHDFPSKALPALVKKLNACLVVVDMCPLHKPMQWVADAGKALAKDTYASGAAAIGGGSTSSSSKSPHRFPVLFHQVDAHNIVPVWVASPKCEFGARTIRPKLTKLKDQYLTKLGGTFPMKSDQMKKHPFAPTLAGKAAFPTPNFQKLLSPVVTKSLGTTVAPITWLTAGEDAAEKHLENFVNNMSGYQVDRNDPGKPRLSDLSPYLHYGMLAPQRAVFEVQETGKRLKKPKVDIEGFVEEAFVRRELADNFCFYRPDTYDSVKGFEPWATRTLLKHKNDKREFIYTQKQLEAGETHDNLWNAAQLEMKSTGKMHGFMRMYWAKKILEWTPSVEVALQTAIYLNDKWSLDGRDPNGYVGCAWSVGGVHDRAWGERPVFGQIRFMNYNGCKGKFDVAAYIGKFMPNAPEAQAKSGKKRGNSVGADGEGDAPVLKKAKMKK